MASVWDKLRANKIRWTAKEAEARGSTPVIAPVVKDPVVLNSGGDSSTSAPYWKKVGGTYTQTRPSLMNKTEYYFYKRKQAGLSKAPTPSGYIADKAVMEAHFGQDHTTVEQPTPTAAELRESKEESRAIYVARNKANSASVEANEYIKHHAEHFGTDEAKSLGAGLHNLYSDSYAVVTPKEGVNVVVNSEKDEVFVIADSPLSEKEKQGYTREIDRAGDTPNRPIFIENTGPSENSGVAASSSGGGATMGKGTLLLLAGAAVVALIIFRGKR